MKEDIYLWMKSLAVFYILLTCVLHLVPDGKYERYVRFFMGLVLTVMLCSPIFSVLGESGNLLAEFEIQYEQEDLLREQKEKENIQEVYLWREYRAQAKEEVRKCLEAAGIFPAEVEAEFSEEQLFVTVYLRDEPDAETERRIQDELLEACGIGQGEYQIKVSESWETAVDRAASSGTSSGSGDASGIR